MVVFKKNGKLKICADFRKLNKATKKYPYLLPFSDEILNTIVGYEAYSFLDTIKFKIFQDTIKFL